MSKLITFFDSLDKEKAALTNASSGKDFESNIELKLKKSGFSKISLETDDKLYNYLQEIKEQVQSKLKNTLLPNSLYLKDATYKDVFVWQPYGSQDFPDYLLLTEHKIFAVEIKYSTKTGSKPMWNSNLPKKDALYIFGSYGKKDITYFRGEDILPEKERKFISKIWDDTETAYEKWKKEYADKLASGEIVNTFGFEPYIRKAYQQKKKDDSTNLDFLNNPSRADFEKKLKEFIKEHDE